MSEKSRVADVVPFVLSNAPLGVETAAMLSTSPVELHRAPWVQDSSFPSQVAFRFE